MPVEHRLKVVLCWHMHQPHYLDHESGQYQLPWTYLHAIKDYLDMAAYIESNPAARAVVNFAPTLLEQIDDYARQIRSYLEEGSPIGDPLLAALVSPALPADEEHRVWLIKSCLRANERRLINRFPPFRNLAALARCINEYPHSIAYVNGQYLADLLAWYHLVWIGETVRRKDGRVLQLMEKGSGYSQNDRRQILTIMAAAKLGILKADISNDQDTPDGVIQGLPLGGLTLADRLFLEDAVVSADLALSVPSVTIGANLGFVGVELPAPAASVRTSAPGSRARAPPLWAGASP